MCSHLAPILDVELVDGVGQRIEGQAAAGGGEQQGGHPHRDCEKESGKTWMRKVKTSVCVTRGDRSKVSERKETNVSQSSTYSCDRH